MMQGCLHIHRLSCRYLGGHVSGSLKATPLNVPILLRSHARSSTSAHVASFQHGMACIHASVTAEGAPRFKAGDRKVVLHTVLCKHNRQLMRRWPGMTKIWRAQSSSGCTVLQRFWRTGHPLQTVMRPLFAIGITVKVLSPEQQQVTSPGYCQHRFSAQLCLACQLRPQL